MIQEIFVVAAVLMAGANAGAAEPPSTTRADVSDLPLIEVPQKDDPTNCMAVLLSGDGGWWTLDRIVAETMAEHGVPTVGISSFKYFKTPRTPESFTDDVARILRHYLAAWGKEKVVLIGYSLGAEIMPFAANRLPEDLRNKVKLLILIGPSAETVFEFHYTDWIRPSSAAKKYPVKPEIEAVKRMRVLCVGSTKDSDCICGQLSGEKIEPLNLPGDHHFDDKFKDVAEAIWKKAFPAAASPAQKK